MTKVLAALDSSPVARNVLATSAALADVLESDVEAVHVGARSSQTVRNEAARADVPLRVVAGEVLEVLVAEGASDDVETLVIGARGIRTDPRPLGSTALAVATSLRKPVVVVPPEARAPGAVRRVLVPLEGSVSAALAPRSIIELAQDARIEVVVLHVHDARSLPSFTDQPQHEQSAWAGEFLARYCPWGVGAVRLETRVGSSAAEIPAFAAESGCELIALGWSQDLAAGRAPVVRAVLERAGVPVMLVPVTVAEGNAAQLGVLAIA
jgi:nucleotide-binding universal stress UspA family protein